MMYVNCFPEGHHMEKAEKALKIVEILKKLYPDVSCSLEFGEPWQLLFSARLAAQCTDKRVNEVAKVLYVKYPTLEAMANADMDELESVVKPTGFYHAKARDLKNGAITLLSESAEKSQTVDKLCRFGVGRIAKPDLATFTASRRVVADTHCIGCQTRFGLCDRGPEEVEFR